MKLDGIPVYSFDTLMAKKLKAFYERDEGKDVYDIYYSLKINNNLPAIIKTLKEVLKSARIDYDDFAKEMPRKLSDVQLMKSLRLSANPYIPKNLRMDFERAASEISQKIVAASQMIKDAKIIL